MLHEWVIIEATKKMLDTRAEVKRENIIPKLRWEIVWTTIKGS
jgi:hypothetical protein